MKTQLKTTVATLALITLFASASIASSPADEYEFTALDNDVVIQYTSNQSHHDCNSFAALQNRVDLVLENFQYDLVISDNDCSHPDQDQIQSALMVESILTDLGYDG